ncbi:MAG: S9 family peptidase [Actinomycetota bacterium]
MALPDLVPVDVLFGNPERTQPRICPDGTKVGFLAPVEGVLNIWVGGVGSDDTVDDFRPVTNDRGRGIQPFQWDFAFDGRRILYSQDTAGDENWRVHSVDLDTGEVTDHTPFPGVQTQILKVSERVPDEVLLGINRDDPRLHDVYRLDLRTGELTKEVTNEGFDQWLVDHDLVVRGATRPTEDGGQQLLMRKGPDWNVAIDTSPDDYLINVTGPLAFSGDGARLFHVSVEGSDTARLVATDTETGETQVLAEDPDFDVYTIGISYESAIFHPRTHEPQFAPVIRERQEYVVIDPDVAGDLDKLREAATGEIRIVSRDLADERWIVQDVRDSGPAAYHLYDRTTGERTLLFEDQPALNAYTLANVEAFTFTAGDGLKVQGYLTFPPGVERENLPSVLHVHGGPWGGRHQWGFSAINQWIASRGYVCIEIDFRGSGGYGKAFLNASNHEWAGKMHTDLIDGLEHAIAQGWVDRDRVGIFGGSYGGYAALVGATFTPDVFRCAVDYVGPSNLITLLESIPPYWWGVYHQFRKLLGDLETERDYLWSISPLSKVDDIRIPIFIAQGANDPRVKQAESEQIVEAMRKRGLPCEYLLFEDEGHGFVRPENREKFHLDAERFLAKHLGGRAQT